MSLKPLPPSTVKLLGSAQVITSVSSAVKELVENAIDAGADCVEVKLENYGLDRLEVRDNGSGIGKQDVQFMCQRSYTSKIADFSDLDRLDTYGFRGEALSSLCSVGQVTVTTITSEDDVATSYSLDTLGRVANSALSHITKGTIVIVENMFRNLPVRRQLMSTKRRKTEELKRIEGVVKCLAIVQPRIRLTLAHNKFCIWQKNKVATLRQSLVQAIPPTMVNQLYDLEYCDEEVKIHMMIPCKDCNVHALCYGNLADTFYLFVNKRPVRDRQLDKMIQESIFQYFGHYIPPGKHPMCLVSIELPSHALDVNLEPNKTKVVIKDMDGLIRKLKDLFLSHYVGHVAEELARTPAGDEEAPETAASREKSTAKRKKTPVQSPKSSSEETPIKLAKVETSSNIQDCLKHAPMTSTPLDDGGDNSSNCVSNLSGIIEDPSGDLIDEDKASSFQIVVKKTPASDQNEREKNIMEFLEGLPMRDLFEDNSMEPSTAGVSSSPLDDDNSESSLRAPAQKSLMNCRTEEELSPIDAGGTFTRSVRSQDTTCKEEASPSLYTAELIGTAKGSSSMPTSVAEEALEPSTPSESQSSEYQFACSQECDVSANTGSSPLGEVPAAGMVGEQDGKKEFVNTEDITLSQWSRGDVKLNGEAVLGPGKILGRAGIVKKIAENSQQLERSVSSQMGCKEMSAFTKFAREMRSKIIQEAPGTSFTRVASELASRWKNLQEVEREKYKQVAANEKKKKAEDQRKVDLTTLKVKRGSHQDDKGKGQVVLKRKQYCSTLPVDVSVETLRESIARRLQSKKTFCGNVMIGKSDDGLAYCQMEREVYAFSLTRLKESLCYFDNLANMTIPLRVLEENVEIQESELGELSWNTLSCLETSVDISSGTIFVSDERIVKNGFRIEVIDSPDGKNFQITDLPSQIAYYGVDDLKEVLLEIEHNGFVCNLENCRPLKAVSYIRSETIRQLAQTSSKEDSSNICNVLNYWFTNVRPTTSGNCPHHSPVAKLLRTL